MYTTSKQFIGKNIQGCPQNAHVELELFPSGVSDSFSELLAKTQWAGIWPVPTDKPYVKSIEQATSMSLQEFYQTFSQPTDKCIETPINLWPVNKQ
jgi:hypothetical protein